MFVRRRHLSTILVVIVTAVACHDYSVEPLLLPSSAALPALLQAMPALLGEPVDLVDTATIYWPPDPPPWFTDTLALNEAVRRSQGR